jgi:uncharacterized membrane protein
MPESEARRNIALLEVPVPNVDILAVEADLRIDTVPEQTKYTESGEPVTASVTVSNTGSVAGGLSLTRLQEDLLESLKLAHRTANISLRGHDPELHTESGEPVTASVTVSNTGSVAGAEIVQLWIVPPKTDATAPAPHPTSW